MQAHGARNLATHTQLRTMMLVMVTVMMDKKVWFDCSAPERHATAPTGTWNYEGAAAVAVEQHLQSGAVAS